MFGMAENIDGSVDNVTATISGKWKSDLFCLTLISYMTRKKEIKTCSTNLGVLKRVDLQIKAFQRKLILQSSCSASKKLSASLPSICNLTNA